MRAANLMPTGHPYRAIVMLLKHLRGNSDASNTIDQAYQTRKTSTQGADMRSLLLVFILTVIPALGHAQDSTNQDSTHTQGTGEEGKPQTIKYFSAESDLPLTLGLMIDSSLSMQRMLPEEKIVAGSFLQKVITAKDLAFVVSFDIRVDLLQDLTSDMRLLRKGLDKARINTNTAGMSPMGTPGPVP